MVSFWEEVKWTGIAAFVGMILGIADSFGLISLWS